ncbi:hypothetical protein [Longimycelium tulufanense]|uniref:hypothetical protein n=1 Tax=Longimycelium tulufanense TaxID=907463 RepID=UPI001666D1B0|nr:hypothetical protein [Longimycelium tulufanense]
MDADSYSAYTEQAEYCAVDRADLDEVLPPFTAGLLAATGRLLAVLAYRDAVDYGERPFKRRSVKARHRVLARLPAACDGQGQESACRSPAPWVTWPVMWRPAARPCPDAPVSVTPWN